MHSPLSFATLAALRFTVVAVLVGCSASATDNTDSPTGDQGTGNVSGQTLGGRASAAGGSSAKGSSIGGNSSRSSGTLGFTCEANQRCPAASNRAVCTNSKGQTCTCFSATVYCL